VCVSVLQGLFEPAVPSRPCYITKWRNVFIYFYSARLFSVFLRLWFWGFFLLPLPPSGLGAFAFVRPKRANVCCECGLFSFLLVGGLSCLLKELAAGFKCGLVIVGRGLNELRGGRCPSEL